MSEENKTCKGCIHEGVCKFEDEAKELNANLPKSTSVFTQAITCSRYHNLSTVNFRQM